MADDVHRRSLRSSYQPCGRTGQEGSRFMKVGLLGTGFGLAHAGIYHRHPEVDEVVVFGRAPSKLERLASDFGFATTTDIETIYADAGIDLVDVCLLTPLHADHVIRALDSGKHVLCDLPLAATLTDAHRVVDAHAGSNRQVFVDMIGRFDPANELLRGAIADRSYGALKTLHVATRCALLWEGYDLRLDSIVMDVMHSNLDAIVTALGRPQSMSAAGIGRDGRGSAVDVVLTYPHAIASCSGSSLMPRAYGVRGGWRATLRRRPPREQLHRRLGRPRFNHAYRIHRGRRTRHRPAEHRSLHRSD
jgi:predicted dehydrogenase